MTRVGKPVVRETAAEERGRSVVIELHPRHLVVRLKGLPTSARVISYARLAWLAEKERLDPAIRAAIEPRKRGRR